MISCIAVKEYCLSHSSKREGGGGRFPPQLIFLLFRRGAFLLFVFFFFLCDRCAKATEWWWTLWTWRRAARRRCTGTASCRCVPRTWTASRDSRSARSSKGRPSATTSWRTPRGRTSGTRTMVNVVSFNFSTGNRAEYSASIFPFHQV